MSWLREGRLARCRASARSPSPPFSSVAFGPSVWVFDDDVLARVPRAFQPAPDRLGRRACGDVRGGHERGAGLAARGQRGQLGSGLTGCRSCWSRRTSRGAWSWLGTAPDRAEGGRRQVPPFRAATARSADGSAEPPGQLAHYGHGNLVRDVSAETPCARFHKPLPRKRGLASSLKHFATSRWKTSIKPGGSSPPCASAGRGRRGGTHAAAAWPSVLDSRFCWPGARKGRRADGAEPGQFRPGGRIHRQEKVAVVGDTLGTGAGVAVHETGILAEYFRPVAGG